MPLLHIRPASSSATFKFILLVSLQASCWARFPYVRLVTECIDGDEKLIPEKTLPARAGPILMIGVVRIIFDKAAAPAAYLDWLLDGGHGTKGRIFPPGSISVPRVAVQVYDASRNADT